MSPSRAAGSQDVEAASVGADEVAAEEVDVAEAAPLTDPGVALLVDAGYEPPDAPS